MDDCVHPFSHLVPEASEASSSASDTNTRCMSVRNAASEICRQRIVAVRDQQHRQFLDSFVLSPDSGGLYTSPNCQMKLNHKQMQAMRQRELDQQQQQQEAKLDHQQGHVKATVPQQGSPVPQRRYTPEQTQCVRQRQQQLAQHDRWRAQGLPMASPRMSTPEQAQAMDHQFLQQGQADQRQTQTQAKADKPNDLSGPPKLNSYQINLFAQMEAQKETQKQARESGQRPTIARQRDIVRRQQVEAKVRAAISHRPASSAAPTPPASAEAPSVPTTGMAHAAKLSTPDACSKDGTEEATMPSQQCQTRTDTATSAPRGPMEMLDVLIAERQMAPDLGMMARPKSLPAGKSVDEVEKLRHQGLLQEQHRRAQQVRMLHAASIRHQQANSGTQPGPQQASAARPHQPPSAASAYLEHSTAPRISTDTVIANALKKQYPTHNLTIAAENNCQLLAFAAAGHAVAEPATDKDVVLSTLSWKSYLSPARRLDSPAGRLGERAIFAKYQYRWSGHDYTVYLVDGRDGAGAYPAVRNYYILGPAAADTDRLILAAGKWSDDLHDEILVFDQGAWTKSAELFASVRGAKWEDVILDEAMKQAVIDDHLSFFRSRDTYAGLKVPWKRGLIYHGPPGNGKTISIKATMNMLYRLTPQVPTLYVRTLASWAGPERSVHQVFELARRYAPCYLVFEDLDTIVSDTVRSYFLNEVDGLKNNDGIFMVGSTNHLDRLDPGISKRPSRFDRKYFFPNPDLEQRIAYCMFWRKKLGKNSDVEFPEQMCKAVAEITDKFSFAYMQEAFVAALLAIARDADAAAASMDVDGEEEDGSDGEGEDDWVKAEDESAHEHLDYDGEDYSDGYSRESVGDGGELDDYVLWVELKKQVAILREGLDDQDEGKGGW